MHAARARHVIYDVTAGANVIPDYTRTFLKVPTHTLTSTHTHTTVKFLLQHKKMLLTIHKPLA